MKVLMLLLLVFLSVSCKTTENRSAESRRLYHDKN